MGWIAAAAGEVAFFSLGEAGYWDQAVKQVPSLCVLSVTMILIVRAFIAEIKSVREATLKRDTEQSSANANRDDESHLLARQSIEVMARNTAAFERFNDQQDKTVDTLEATVHSLEKNNRVLVEVQRHLDSFSD